MEYPHKPGNEPNETPGNFPPGQEPEIPDNNPSEEKPDKETPVK